jgi:hypothetical protein
VLADAVVIGAAVILTGVGVGLAAALDDALADFMADGLLVGVFSVGDADLVAVGEVADSPDGVLAALTSAIPGACVRNENSAASPATVPVRVSTARRMQPP